MECIYKIIFPNGKLYIGQTNNLERRKKEHIADSFSTNRAEYYLPVGNAIRKYYPNISFDIIREENNSYNRNELEKYYINLYNTTDRDKGYNIRIGGNVLSGTDSPRAVFTEKEVTLIRLLKEQGERKIEVYNNYFSDKKFSIFEKVWLGESYKEICHEIIDKTKSISREVSSSLANRGENNNKAKLTEEQVITIRKLFEEGKTIKEIHKIYNFVNVITIKRIIKRQTWKHL